jgi:kynurenine formamidase
MAVHNEMIVFPRVIRPALLMYEDWEKFAEGIGAAKYGITSLTASCLTVLGDHVGTHIDAMKHIVPSAAGAEGIPLEYCYGDGVLLDFRHKEKGAGISVADLKEALRKINYAINIGVNLGELAVEIDNLGDRRCQAHSCDNVNEMMENRIHSL